MFLVGFRTGGGRHWDQCKSWCSRACMLSTLTSASCTGKQGPRCHPTCPCKLSVEAQLPLQEYTTSLLMSFQVVLSHKLCLLLRSSTPVMYEGGSLGGASAWKCSLGTVPLKSARTWSR